MKIGIDAFGCDQGKSGTGAYLSSIVDVLAENEQLDFELFGPSMDRFAFNENTHHSYKGVDIKNTESAQRWWHFFKSGKFSVKNKYDVLLFIAGSRMIPPFFRKPSVVVVNEVLSNNIKKKRLV